ncbi:MAG: hypothetical protein AAGA99_06510 [Actinomycetota bacterium]
MRPLIAAGIAGLAFGLVAIAGPLGAQSGNDDPAAALLLVPEATPNGATVALGAGSTVDAATDGEPFPPVFSGGAVWWAWDAPSSVGTLTVSTDGSDFDTVLSVWRGEPGELELLAWSDDVDFLEGDLHSEVSIAVEGGERYHIAVAGYLYSHVGETTPRAGDVSLSATWSPVELITASADGTSTADVSADGRYIAFVTTARLLADDTDELADVYRIDPVAGEVVLVSAGDDEQPRASSAPSISADGSVVAFVTRAREVDGEDDDDNDELNVFVHDLDTGEIQLVSRALDGSSANAGSISPSLSADGRRVAFTSFASNLTSIDDNGVIADVFVHDLDTGETTLVSTDVNGGPANAASLDPVISGDGTVVAFESAANDLTDDDVDAAVDVFVRDLDDGTVRRVPSGSGDAPGWITANPALSADGSAVVVTSRVAEGGPAEILLHELTDDMIATTIVNDDGTRPSISADGRIVAFSVDDDASGGTVSVVDVVLGQTVSIDADLPVGANAVLADDGDRLVVTAPGPDQRSGRVFLVDRGVPAEVTGIESQVGDGRIDLAWEPIEADDYEVIVVPSEGQIVVDGTTAAITGLTNGTAYEVEVRGLSVPGAGPATTLTALPSTAPGELTLSELGSASGELSASWVLADDGGLPTEVSVQVLPTAGVPEIDQEARTVRVTGLDEGVPYALRLVAENDNGQGPVLETGPIVASPSAVGYVLVDDDGGISSFGGAPDLDDLGITTGGQVVAISALPGVNAALVLTSDAVIWARGFEPTGALATPSFSLDLAPGEAVVDLLTGVDARRAWVVTSFGRIITRGAASSFGDASGEQLAAPVVAGAMAPDGQGYVLVSADGGIFTYGSARFAGSLTAEQAAGGVVDVITDPDGTGYWVITADGGVFAFEARFAGSLADTELNSPLVAAAAVADGYVLVAEDGGVFNFTEGPFLGGLGDEPLPDPIVDLTPVIG